MPSEDNKILEFNHNQKFDKASFIIYAHLCIFIIYYLFIFNV